MNVPKLTAQFKQGEWQRALDGDVGSIKDLVNRKERWRRRQ